MVSFLLLILFKHLIEFLSFFINMNKLNKFSHLFKYSYISTSHFLGIITILKETISIHFFHNPLPLYKGTFPGFLFFAKNKVCIFANPGFI